MPIDRDIMIRKAGAVGKPVIGIRLRIVYNDGKDVLLGSPGEIVLRGGIVFKGY